MNIDTYKSASNRGKFVSVRHGDDITKKVIPDPDFQQVYIHHENVSIDSSDRRIAFDSAEAIKAIEADGHYLHAVKMITTAR